MRRWTTTRTMLLLAVAALVALGALSACGGGSDEDKGTSTPAADAGTPNITPEPGSGTSMPDATNTDGAGGTSGTPVAPGRDIDNQGRSATREAEQEATEAAEDDAREATEDARDEMRQATQDARGN